VTFKALQLDSSMFDEFVRQFWEGHLGKVRFGQAFYNYYNLHLLSNQAPFSKVYELEGDAALSEIHRLVDFN